MSQDSTKQNLTIRLAPDLRAKLEFIANRELRTLSNQITKFLIEGVDCYMEGNQLFEIPLQSSASKPKEPGDIPF